MIKYVEHIKMLAIYVSSFENPFRFVVPDPIFQATIGRLCVHVHHLKCNFEKFFILLSIGVAYMFCNI